MDSKLISFQQEITLPEYSKGFHLITIEVLQLVNIKGISVGTFHLFIKHTSASLSINEDADPSVRIDFENYFQKLAPKMEPYYTHTSEGSDDMPAHLKASILGSSVSIPISNGKLNLGTWQGIYLGEHRDYGGRRKLVATVMGSSI